jgi:predicted transcriptional regulator
MFTKKHLKETIVKLPEEFSLEDLINKLILLDKIERAEKESERGETITEEELDKELKKWFNEPKF